MPDDAIVTINSDGTYGEATPSALAILGVTQDQLAALPPGAFSVEPVDADANAAFRSSWEDQGGPELIGEATVQRPDGGQRRVRFHIIPLPDGTFHAQLRQVEAPTEAPGRLYTSVGEILAAWRAAERRLDTITREGPEWTAIQGDLESFRSAYQDVFRTRMGGDQGT